MISASERSRFISNTDGEDDDGREGAAKMTRRGSMSSVQCGMWGVFCQEREEGWLDFCVGLSQLRVMWKSGEGDREERKIARVF